MPASVERITISRDLPFAQKRIAQKDKLTGMRFLSDYRDASFGRSVGLLMEDTLLLTRAVILVDKRGVVRYSLVHELKKQPDNNTILEEIKKLR